MISQETKELILAQTDIVEIIGRDVNLQRVGSQFRANCPFHQEKTPSFYVTPSMQRYKCFGCGVSGDVVTFLMEYRNLPFIDALRELGKLAGVPIVEEAFDPEADRERRHRTRLSLLQTKAARFFNKLLLTHPDAQHARDYLKSRGFNRDTAERWVIGWIPEKPGPFLDWAKQEGFSGRELCGTGLASPRDVNQPRAGLFLRFYNRLMFPIHNDYGDVIAFSGRQLVEDKKSGKYINSPETILFKKSKVFFGLHQARQAIGRAKNVVLVEGQTDAIACHEAGFPQTIAALGTARTKDHARLLKRYTDTIIICPDGDTAGHKSTGAGFNEFAPLGLIVKVAALPEGDDPDSFIKRAGREAFQKLLDEAGDFFDYQIDFAQKNVDLSQPLNRARLANALAAYLKKIPDPISRDTLMGHCATRLGVGLPEFRESFRKVKEERTYGKKDESSTPVVRPRIYDPALLRLCHLALISTEVQNWLCEQTEGLVESLGNLAGRDIILRIVGKRPNPKKPSEINTFLRDCAPEDQLTLTSVLEEPIPEEPLRHATKALSKLAFSSIRERLDRIQSLLKDTNNDSETVTELLQESKQLTEMLREQE